MARPIIHGQYGTDTYTIWKSMLARCYNPRRKDYKHYGGRGIQVSESWFTFQNFFRDMGPRPPGRSIDRIDPNGPYCKENCRWATMKEQRINQRHLLRYPFEGKMLTMGQISDLTGIPANVLAKRIHDLRWDYKLAFTKPVRQWGRRAVG